MNQVVVRSKVWLEYRGQPFLGDGRYRLLLAVESCGSINAAAGELGISYRKAWAQLRQMEEHAPFPLLVMSKGGKGGGSTRLTAEAHALLQRFASLKEGLNRLVDDKFAGTAAPDDAGTAP